ncbi:uncharacterized protein H6S33_010806 [Morchella sextelata]|uniref:uncharacterized protein n=1 Tax=Morchella sextelata TaxID=1174677 RepID=UPI001D037CEE|nr:uncharacterized protein H6S33_010806 [Morchella sextelata]KAH0611541.1 hypothetical protein H6S33_010806 [Morchella sextelata]
MDMETVNIERYLRDYRFYSGRSLSGHTHHFAPPRFLQRSEADSIILTKYPLHCSLDWWGIFVILARTIETAKEFIVVSTCSRGGSLTDQPSPGVSASFRDSSQKPTYF